MPFRAVWLLVTRLVIRRGLERGLDQAADSCSDQTGGGQGRGHASDEITSETLPIFQMIFENRGGGELGGVPLQRMLLIVYRCHRKP